MTSRHVRLKEKEVLGRNSPESCEKIRDTSIDMRIRKGGREDAPLEEAVSGKNANTGSKLKDKTVRGENFVPMEPKARSLGGRKKNPFSWR